MKYAEGTVISGTLRPQDLGPVFAALVIALTDDQKEETRQRVGRYLDAILARPESDAAAELLDAMADEITALLPDGLWFGPHEGDPADFGIWAEVMDR